MHFLILGLATKSNHKVKCLESTDQKNIEEKHIERSEDSSVYEATGRTNFVDMKPPALLLLLTARTAPTTHGNVVDGDRYPLNEDDNRH